MRKKYSSLRRQRNANISICPCDSQKTFGFKVLYSTTNNAFIYFRMLANVANRLAFRFFGKKNNSPLIDADVKISNKIFRQ